MTRRRRSSELHATGLEWWAHQDSNLGPADVKGSAHQAGEALSEVRGRM